MPPLPRNLVERAEGLHEREGFGAGRLREALPLVAQDPVVVLARAQPLPAEPNEQRCKLLLVEVDLPEVDQVGDSGGRVAVQPVAVEVEECEAAQLADLGRDGPRQLVVVERESRAPGWSNAVESATFEAARWSPRGGGGAPSGWASPWECRADQSRQARPEEAQGASWGTAKEGTLTMVLRRKVGFIRHGSRNGWANLALTWLPGMSCA